MPKRRRCRHPRKFLLTLGVPKDVRMWCYGCQSTIIVIKPRRRARRAKGRRR